jgi:hypothetical protein
MNRQLDDARQKVQALIKGFGTMQAAFRAMAKLMPGVRPGTLMMDHAWEPHQFVKRLGMDEPVAGLVSPLELAGGWGHLQFGAEWDGNQLAYETSVDVTKA